MPYYLYLNDAVRGPYDDQELADMLRHREIAPETPACRAGSEEWFSAGSLFSTPGSSALPASISPTPAPAGFQSAASAVPAPSRAKRDITEYFQAPEPQKYPGLNRLTYFILGMTISVVQFFLPPLMVQDHSRWPALIIWSAGGVLTFVLIILRVINTGLSFVWGFLSLVPVLNLFFLIWLQAAQTGYRAEGRLDSAGRKIVLAYVLVILAILGLLFLGFCSLSMRGG